MTTKELDNKIQELLSDLDKEDLDRVSITINMTNEEIDDYMLEISQYYLLMGAGGENAMWVGTGVEPPYPIELPDPNEEFKRRMRKEQ